MMASPNEPPSVPPRRGQGKARIARVVGGGVTHVFGRMCHAGASFAGWPGAWDKRWRLVCRWRLGGASRWRASRPWHFRVPKLGVIPGLNGTTLLCDPCHRTERIIGPMFEWADDLKIRNVDLYLDSRQPRQTCFVSHAHTDHLGIHQTAIATAATAALAEHRIGTQNTCELAFGEEHTLDADTTL